MESLVDHQPGTEIYMFCLKKVKSKWKNWNKKEHASEEGEISMKSLVERQPVTEQKCF